EEPPTNRPQPRRPTTKRVEACHEKENLWKKGSPPPHRSAGGNAYRSGKARPRKHRDHAQSTRVPRPPRAHGQRGRFRVRKRPANAGTRTSPARNHRRGGHVSRLHRQTEPKRPTSRRCRPGEG